MGARSKRQNKARNPESLIHTMWWLLTQQFGLRGRQEHRRMRLEDFRIMKGVDDLEFVEFAEGPTKTRPGCLNAKSRQFQPRMFQTGRERCPVALFRQYISQRPPNLRTNGPFISQQNTADDLVIKFGTKSSPWKKINQLRTTLGPSEKRFSNHSARKTLVGKMKKANLERSSIAGHWSQKYPVFR